MLDIRWICALATVAVGASCKANYDPAATIASQDASVVAPQVDASTDRQRCDLPADAGVESDTSCGDARCDYSWECLDGGCCPFMRACWTQCCNEDEFCNVYQCFRPILCGPKLPACPAVTYCENYAEGKRECNRMGDSWRRDNAEFCDRQVAGAEWMAKYARSPSDAEAVGTCFPEMAPHRLHERWYRWMGKPPPRR